MAWTAGAVWWERAAANDFKLAGNHSGGDEQSCARYNLNTISGGHPTSSLTRLSVLHRLNQAKVQFALQHIFDLFSAVVFQTLQAQLLAGLIASDKFALNSQSPIRHFLPTVVAHFFSPYSSLPTSPITYFFWRYLSSLTLLSWKEMKPMRLAKVSSSLLTILKIVRDRASFMSNQDYSQQWISY